MSTAIQPILGGTTMPYPDQQSYTLTYRGGTLEMADGSIVHDMVDGSTARHMFQLTWKLLTDTELGTLKTAYATVKDTTASFTSVNNVVYTVTRPERGEMQVEIVVTSQGTLAYNVSFTLIEDS